MPREDERHHNPAPEASPDEAHAPSTSHAPLMGRVDLTQGNLLRGLIRLSWPVVTGAFLNWVMGVADIKMVGYLGPDAIAAVGTSRGAIFTLMAVIFALSTGTQVLVARYMGERNPERAAGVARQALILSAIFGVALMPAGMYLAHPLLAALGADGAVLTQGAGYMQVYMLGALALMMNFMIAAALNGAGDTLTPLIGMAFVNAANILLDWLLIFGIGPFPELGVEGAAWAVVISRSLASVALLWVLASGRFAIRMRVLTGWRIDLATWGKMFYLGVPSSIQGLTRNLAYLMLLAILNSTDAGARAVAGYTICGQIQMVGLMVGLAFMSAAMTAMSQNMGARDVARAERSCWTVVKISTISVAALAAAFIATGPWLIGFFTTDQEAMHWGRVSLNILSAVLPFVAISMAFSGALRGAGDTMSPLYTSLLCTSGIGPGLAWLFTVVLGAGPTGAWWGLAVGIILQALLLTWIFRRGRWRDIRI
ncbi:MAG: MATE family efflux transporter [Armatimonadetes bacterium]|nr:MATE family efflux transporter [Armatimonadota bacterium]